VTVGPVAGHSRPWNTRRISEIFNSGGLLKAGGTWTDQCGRSKARLSVHPFTLHLSRPGQRPARATVFFHFRAAPCPVTGPWPAVTRQEGGKAAR